MLGRVCLPAGASTDRVKGKKTPFNYSLAMRGRATGISDAKLGHA